MDNIDFDSIAFSAFTVAGFILFMIALGFLVARTVVREYRDHMDWMEYDRSARSEARRRIRRPQTRD